MWRTLPFLFAGVVAWACLPPEHGMLAGLVLLALSNLLVLGAATLTLASSEISRFHPAARAGLSLGLGLVAMPLVLLLASIAGWPPTPWIGLAAAAVLWAVVLAAARHRLSGWLAPAPVPSTRAHALPWLGALDMGLCLSIALLWLLVAIASVNEPLAEWDVLAIWGYKAKVVLVESIATSSYFGDLTRAYSHLDYPLLWPFALAWVWSWVGTPDVLVVKLLAPVTLAAYLATFFGLLLRRGDRTSALLFTALLAGLPMVLSQNARLMADFPLGYFAMIAGIATYLWLEEQEGDLLGVAALGATGLLLTKNEGAAIFLVLCGAGLLAAWSRRDGRSVARAALWLPGVPLLLAGPWFVFRLGLPNVHTSGASPALSFHPAQALDRIDRIPEVVGLAGAYAVELQDWLLFWPVAVLLLAYTVRHWITPPGLFLLACAQLPLLAYLYVFVASPWQPEILMEGGFSRLLLHVAPLVVFLLAEGVRRAGLLPWLPSTPEPRAGEAIPTDRLSRRRDRYR